MTERLPFDNPTRGIWILASLLAPTWRYRWLGSSIKNLFRSRSQAVPGRVSCFWHGNLLPLFYLARGRGIAALVSRSPDGTRLSAILQRWGYRLIRGSSSRGGPEALQECIAAVSSGTDLIITPDGPRGPARQMKRGVVRIALETGASIVPIAMRAEHAWRLKTWDRFMIPWPFSRMHVAAAGPIDPAVYRGLADPQASLIRDVAAGMNALG